MNKPLVSIVVPIYKVEAYLERCLDSIIAQYYRPLEVILVNDGSPDGCSEIIRHYESKWSFVQSIWQENGGLGAARNAGIKRATGKYLALIDSDDHVEPDFISHMVNIAECNSADAVVCNFYFDLPSGLTFPFPLLTARKKLSGADAARISLKLLRIPTFAWNKLYRTALFQEAGILFPSIYYEDIATMSRVLIHAERVSITQKPLYHYCIRKSSITGNFKHKNINDYLKAVDIIRQFIWNAGLWDCWKRSYRRFLRAAESQLFIEINLKMSSVSLAERHRMIIRIHEQVRQLSKPPLRDQMSSRSGEDELTA